MAKPRGKITRSNRPQRAETGIMGGPEIGIYAWCPDDQAKEPPEQVHLHIRIQGMKTPLVIRFKSPDTLGFIVEELERYRRHVWPLAEPLDLSGDWPIEETT